MMKLFYDSEFTGLTQATTLISVALVTEGHRYFYAEFTDFDRTQVDDFIAEQVLTSTLWMTNGQHHSAAAKEPCVVIDQVGRRVCGDKAFVISHLLDWLAQLTAGKDLQNQFEIWADHVAYDWVLFCQLFGGALNLPASIHYIPRDFCTYLSCNGYDPDCARMELCQQLGKAINDKKLALPVGQQSPDSAMPSRGAGSDNPLDAVFSNQHNALADALLTLECYQLIEAVK